jgi:formylglycine-generating enzyme required for sulfatase activity
VGDPDVISPFSIPLGAYQGVTSPWGLYDCAGATSEWTEEILQFFPNDPIDPNFRALMGSWWLDGGTGIDRINYWSGALSPNVSTFDNGFRIASSVPSPGAGTVAASSLLMS